jgi:ABC-type glycerol-3-phosphate transport system permease component
MKFIAFAQDPERQLVMFRMLGQGPANPAADALLPAEESRFNPVAPRTSRCRSRSTCRGTRKTTAPRWTPTLASSRPDFQRSLRPGLPSGAAPTRFDVRHSAITPADRPASDVLVLAYLIPFLGVMRWSVTLPEPGLQNYRTALTDPLVQAVLWRTFRICALVTVISVAAAYMLALIWVRGGPAARLAVELCILIPFWISVLTRAFGWLALLSNRGLVNNWLQSLGVCRLNRSTLVRNEFGVVVGMVHFLIPFAVFPAGHRHARGR